jgi:hypothetical protein
LSTKNKINGVLGFKIYCWVEIGLLNNISPTVIFPQTILRFLDLIFGGETLGKLSGENRVYYLAKGIKTFRNLAFSNLFFKSLLGGFSFQIISYLAFGKKL